jgi:hypothetical protein
MLETMPAVGLRTIRACAAGSASDADGPTARAAVTSDHAPQREGARRAHSTGGKGALDRLYSQARLCGGGCAGTGALSTKMLHISTRAAAALFDEIDALASSG